MGVASDSRILMFQSWCLYYTAASLPLDQPWVSALPTAVAGKICHLSSAFVDEGLGGKEGRWEGVTSVSSTQEWR